MIGYWAGPRTSGSWPDPTAMVDEAWDEEERYAVGLYLTSGTIARLYMGYSQCRICGKDNGAVEFSDGVYVWPEGLGHYVEQHAVRLPLQFVTHVLARADALANAERDENWWRSSGS